MRSRNDGGGRRPLTDLRPRPARNDSGAPVESGGGVLLEDPGREYPGLLDAPAANVHGRGHPAVAPAVSAPAATTGPVPKRPAAGPAALLGELLLALTGPGRVLFTGSGAEANEVAVRVARRTGRCEVVATGSSPGAPAPISRPVTQVPFGDAAALRAAVGGATAAVVLEPIQGGAGVVVPPAGYLAEAREICTAAGALLVLDEARTGLGRTGYWFRYQGEGAEPDLLTLADGLGGDLPLGACLAFGAAAELLTPDLRAAPAAGDPAGCTAGLAMIRTIARSGLLDHVKRVGDRLRCAVEGLAHPLIAGARGAGLLIGIVFTEPIAVPVADRLCAAGFLVDAVQPGVLRLAPPLTLTAAQADAFVVALGQALGGLPAVTSRSRVLMRDAA